MNLFQKKKTGGDQAGVPYGLPPFAAYDSVGGMGGLFATEDGPTVKLTGMIKIKDIQLREKNTKDSDGISAGDISEHLRSPIIEATFETTTEINLEHEIIFVTEPCLME